ncbi:DUF2339 domain-containing protein [Tomitella fengzijianii]|nr:DUF2339 domain-containing protein [Tomitella fengzijianii]
MNHYPGSAVTAERIDAQLRELSRRVSEVSADFTAFVRTDLAEPARPQVQYATPRAPAAPYPQPPYPQPPSSQAPSSQAHFPQAPWPQPPYPQSAPPRPPAAARKSVAERLSSAAERGLVGRVLATFGVAITLIGVVLLLVLAAQAGLLRPEVRVAGGAALAVALFAAGARIGRHTPKRSGAAALVATGVATALFDVLACSTIYHWLPPVAGVLSGGAIAGAGLVLAHRWDSQALCLMVSVPVLVFAPVITDGSDEVLVGFTLAYAAAVLWPGRGRDWTAVFLVNTAGATLPLLAAGVSGDPADWFFGAAVAANLTLALASALILLPSSSRPVLIALGSAAAALPVMALPGVLDRPSSAAVAAVCALLLVGVVIGTAHRTPVPLGARSVWLSAAALIAPVTVAYAATDDVDAAALLGIALVAAVAVRHAGSQQRVLLVIATALAGIGLCAMAAAGAVEQLWSPDALDTPRRVGMLVAAAVAIAVVGVLAAAWAARPRLRAEYCWTVGGVLCLGLLTQVCLGTAQLITGGTESGFRAGHTAATLVWFAAAAAALLRARRLHDGPRAITLTAGLAVSVAAVGKLFLFDLSALDGLFRVVAFVAAGLVLLALGVAYAQSLGADGSGHGVHPHAPAGSGR